MRIAIVGSGVSGLVCAHLLSPRHDVVLFEADDRVGGHAHTVEVAEGPRRLAVDTGFIVFNSRTYPSFVRLLQRLGVGWQESDMSLSARSEARDLEYNGRDLDALYGQRANLLSPRFHRMVLDVPRFYREARALAEAPGAAGADLPLGDWLARRGFSRAFVEDHLLPLVGAVWSSGPEGMRAFPAAFLARFLHHHGMLQLSDRVPWLTVRGGSRAYVRAILEGLRGEVRTSCPVEAVRREERQVVVQARGAAPERFDHLVLACHADQALRLLADPSPRERELLSAFPYRENPTVLHTDEALLPRRRQLWASWNCHLDAAAGGGAGGAAVTYWMNHLQRLEAERTYLVTLNRERAIDPARVVRRFSYAHPVFTVAGAAAQARHGELSGERRTSYCGAYWRNGFHEDGVVSALRVCQRFEVGL